MKDKKAILYMKGNLRVYDDGSCVIKVSPDGLPAFQAIVPAPFETPDGRRELILRSKQSLLMGGWFVTGERLIKNPAFDEDRTYTSTRLSYRVCKSEGEAESVLAEIRELFGTMHEIINPDQHEDER